MSNIGSSIEKNIECSEGSNIGSSVVSDIGTNIGSSIEKTPSIYYRKLGGKKSRDQ